MESQITVGDVTVQVVRKKVRNLNLSVHPPHGQVRLSAPHRASRAEIHAFAASKLDWIRRHQERIRAEARDRRRSRPREPRYVDGELHHVWGRRVVLRVETCESPASIELTPRRLRLRVRPGTTRDERRGIVESWYREQLREALPPLLARWERRLGVRTRQVRVRRMKTRWGSCTPSARSIRLSTELAAHPPEQLEYILVHELVHLLEPSHNGRFHALMDHYLPDWRARRDALERGLS